MKKDTKRVGIPTGIIKQHAEKMYICVRYFFLRKKKDLQFDLLFVNNWLFLSLLE